MEFAFLFEGTWEEFDDMAKMGVEARFRHAR
jgi:hypothetical protein